MDTTRKLTAIDFMMMDVHRELDKEDFDPETMLDKSARPQQEEHGDEEGVGVSYEEEPTARCLFCFGPAPCPKHGKIIDANIVSTNDIDPIGVLAGAHNEDLVQVVVVGVRRNGKEYLASSFGKEGDAIYLLQRGIHWINVIIDEDIAAAKVPPKTPA